MPVQVMDRCSKCIQLVATYKNADLSHMLGPFIICTALIPDSLDNIAETQGKEVQRGHAGGYAEPVEGSHEVPQPSADPDRCQEGPNKSIVDTSSSK